ncbi:hypothetical protein MTZ49_05600 [Entomomonas sp. E2T0]|uniref:sulfatase-like hydrolase/transferase n=1 Tax=Entomomonas sp. E2T0 TaxID=2930213 RepID=UPI002228487C|nr:sulfatase-like hydrolase/transferase [Entomomonas sp. E2T0]UYZ85033.1 hypothetical protein MTZ49_05600 [Entomomonas sp. E2T0]
MEFFKRLDWFNKDNIVKAFLIGILLPNTLIYLVVIFIDINITRYPINIDYFLPVILLACANRYFKILGGITFILFFCIDALFIILRCIPYQITLPDFFYLLASLFNGPPIFKYYAAGVLVLALFQLVLLCYFSTKANIKSLFLIMSLSFILGIVVSLSLYVNIISSQSFYFIKNYEKVMKLSDDVVLHPTDFDNASKPWFDKLSKNEKLSPKLLLVVNESWGVPKNLEVQQDILAKLKAKKDIFDFFNEGASLAGDNTSSGELRELCESKVFGLSSLFAAHISYGYKKCLPNQLVKQGYNTISLHALSDILYDRKHWYPIVGFNEIYFGGDIDLPKDSFENRAIFDPSLVPFIAEKFGDNKKIFLYWLTLTTHYNYPEKEIKNHRFSCEKFNIPRDIDTCRNLMLQAQYFDALADLVSKPEMAGAEVVVIGDHNPSFFIDKNGQNMSYFVEKEVYWIHFKVKDKKQ